MGNSVEQKFIAYQDAYKDILGELLSGYEKGRYRAWRGFITADGPVMERPAILFVGINPGQGLYMETNHKKSAERMPFRIMAHKACSHSAPFDSEMIAFKDPSHRMDWFTGGNYEGKRWYEASSKNSFPRNMVRIICEVARLKTGEKFVKGERPEWYDGEFGKSLTHMNIYPIATEDTGGLNGILKDLRKAGKDVKKPVEAMRRLVAEVIQPDVIVFEGQTAYNKFMGKRTDLKIPVVVFKRSWGWDKQENIEKIAKRIYEKLK